MAFKTAAGVAAGVAGLQYMHCQNQHLHGSACVLDFADKVGRFQSSLASSRHGMTYEDMMEQLRKDIYEANAGANRGAVILYSADGASRRWTWVAWAAALMAGGGLLRWYAPGLTRHFLPATRASLLEMATAMRRLMGGVRETLERQIRALSGQVESVDRSVAEVSTRVDAVGTCVSRVEEGVHEHARALGKMEKMHVVSLNMLMWLTRAVSDVSQSIEAVPSATKEGLRRLLKESAPCVPELADEDIYTLRCGGGVLGQRDVKKERSYAGAKHGGELTSSLEGHHRDGRPGQGPFSTPAQGGALHARCHTAGALPLTEAHQRGGSWRSGIFNALELQLSRKGGDGLRRAASADPTRPEFYEGGGATEV